MQVQVGILSPVTVGELVYVGPSDSFSSATVGVVVGVVVASVLTMIVILIVMVLCFRLKIKKAKKSKEIM